MREKLTELILSTPPAPAMITGRQQGKGLRTAANIADHLIANGVTIQRYGDDTGRCRIFHCSECGYGVNDIFQENERDYPVGDFNYCPNCGAKVKGGEINGAKE